MVIKKKTAMVKKNKGGRPKEDLADKVDFKQVAKYAAAGFTDEQLAVVLGVCEKTICNWKEDPRFFTALKKGKGSSDARVVESLFSRALGHEYDEVVTEEIINKKGKVTSSRSRKTTRRMILPDVTACIFWLKNRQPQLWRDRRELTGKDGQPLNGPGRVEEMDDATLTAIAAGEDPGQGKDKATRH